MKLIIRITKIILFACLLVACKPGTEKIEQQAREKMQTSKFAEAISLLDEIIKSETAKASIYNMRGVAFYNLNENAKALTDFDLAISIDSSNYQFFYNRGNVKRTLNRPESAVEDYTKALLLENGEYEIYLNRALSFMAIRNVPAAFTDFKQAENLAQSKDASIFFYRGKLNMSIEAFKEALADFTKTIEIEPKNGEAYLGRALAKINLNGEVTEDSCNDITISEQLGFIGAEQFREEYCK